jgi:DNA ligase D-like protein (predicted ligase)/DNA ligase D-like protein (predicted 3'-phosphoesterase)
MLAKDAPAAFSDKDWIFEIKWDGFRAISYINHSLSVKSRNEKELKHNFPELEELANLAPNVVVDGEIVVMQNGKPDFQALLERGKAVSPREIEKRKEQEPATYIVFDILEKDGKSLTKLPLIERKKILQESVTEGKNVLVSDFIEEKGEAYYGLVLEKGLEGVVAKRKDSLYEEGLRTGSWMKIKEIKTCDCVVFGYRRGEHARGGTFGSLVLGLYNPEGKPVYVGNVGTGFSEQTLKSFMEKFEELKFPTTSKKPFNVEAEEQVTWLEPKLVCEVGYQCLTKEMRLRMPRFKHLRDDKTPEQCTLDQITEGKKTCASVDEKLSEYASKRQFAQTPEPKGGVSEKVEKKSNKLIFVIQEHHARRLHFDLRLESGGVLKSWAVPKGMPEKSGERRLAVQVEDHPYDYAKFEGTIPKGEYGAGEVKIWDHGTFEPKLWEDDKIEFTLNGQRLQNARFILVRLKKAKDDNAWLLLKGKD